jgi:YidC/Oxa1 family membrane protein insertase
MTRSRISNNNLKGCSLLKFFQTLLEFFYQYTQNWGWAIILLTILIKIVLFPLMINQFRSMAKMKDIQPKLKEIQDKYKDKPEDLQRRMMELYKTEKVNPFGGCLPMLVQMPILILFYNVLSNHKFIHDVLQNASFYGIILKDNHNLLLAVLSAVSTFLQQKLTMPITAGDQQQQQQKMFLYLMPLMLGYFTWNINAGIGLYWVTSNVLGILQQYIINEYFIVKEKVISKKNL